MGLYGELWLYIGFIWGFYGDNGKQNGSYYLRFRV